MEWEAIHLDLTLHLTPETEAKLASLTGRTPEELALEAILAKYKPTRRPRRARSAERWIAEFRAWLDTHPASSVVTFDDSRESIFEGRGE